MAGVAARLSSNSKKFTNLRFLPSTSTVATWFELVDMGRANSTRIKNRSGVIRRGCETNSFIRDA